MNSSLRGGWVAQWDTAVHFSSALLAIKSLVINKLLWIANMHVMYVKACVLPSVLQIFGVPCL